MAEFLQFGKGDCTEAAGLKRHRGADMLLLVDGIQPQQFTGQVETEDLFIAVFRRPVRLDGPGPDGIDLMEFVPGMVQVFSSLQGAHALDDLFQFDLFGFEVFCFSFCRFLGSF